MASGTINGTTSNKYIDSKIEWSSSPSTANNKSEVTASLYYRRNNTYSGTPTSGTGTFGITIDGQSGSTTFSLTIPNSGAWVKAVTVTKTVSHNSDGKRTITISGSGSIPVASLTSTTCSGSAVLDNIPRQATIVSAPNFTDEENPTIQYSNPAGNAVESIAACISFDGSVADIVYKSLSKTGTSFTFALTDAERDVLRRGTSGKTRTVQFVVRTYIGGVPYYSSLTKTLSIVNANPIFTADQVSYADTNDETKNVTTNPQNIVQGLSSVRVSFGAAEGRKFATIKEYSLSLNGVTKTKTSSGDVDFGAINSSKDVKLSVTATDSRGNTTTVEKTIKVLAWSLPIINATVERLNNYEDETYLTVDASISSVGGKNAIKSITYQYMEFGGSYGQAVPIENKVKNTIQMDKEKEFFFLITVTDAFDHDAKELHLAKGKFPLFIDTEKYSVGINEFPEEGEALRVAGGVARFEEGIRIGKESVADFIVEQGENGYWFYRKWSSGRAEAWTTSAVAFTATPSALIGGYYTSGEISLPSGVFSMQPICVASGRIGTGIGFATIGTVSTTKVTINIFGNQSVETSYITSVNAMGRWK